MEIESYAGIRDVPSQFTFLAIHYGDSRVALANHGYRAICILTIISCLWVMKFQSHCFPWLRLHQINRTGRFWQMNDGGVSFNKFAEV